MHPVCHTLTTTHGKHVAKAKRIEQQGWDYPRHVAGFEAHRRNLIDWLDWVGLIDAGAAAMLDRDIGYCEPYYNSHDALDKDKAVQAETRNVARSVVQVVRECASGG